MGAKLLYRDAQGRDSSVDVIPDGVFLGRAADCAVRTDDAMVSRKNCKISYSGGRWTVEDLGSSNGTFVNEVRVQKQVLNHSDIIRCGTLQVRFVETDGQMARASTAGAPGGSVQVDPAFARTASPNPTSGGGGGLSDQRLMSAKEDEIQALVAERDRLATRLRDTAQELELLHSKAESDQGELRKLRQEVVQLRERANDVSRKSSYRDDEVQANQRIAEELRRDMNELQADHQELKNRFDEVNEECAARGRLLERAQDDVQRFKQTAEELRNKLTELQRIKDEGWKELNNRVGEIEHLREVINEQERILEERRIGLISFESAIKELRGEKDNNSREVMEMKRERDELREKTIRTQQAHEVLEEEHRRLVRAMSELEQGGGRGGGADTARLSEELRAVKVELKKAESERQRFEERLETAERERDRLSDTHANLDVDRAGSEEAKRELEQRLQRAEEGRARAEMARSRAEEEKAEATRARDAALQTAQSQRKKAESLEEDLKQATTGRGGSTSIAEERARKLARELDKLRDELDSAKTAAIQAQPAGGGVDLGKLRKKLEDAYYGINDALAELRTNILLAKDLVTEHGNRVEATAKDTLNEAIQVSADRADDAKGLLKSLLEVIEN